MEIEILKKENELLREENEKLKRELEKYSHSQKKYYENNKELIKEKALQRLSTLDKEKLKQYRRTAYLNRKTKLQKELEENENI